MSNQNWRHSSNGENFSSCKFKTRAEAIADAEACHCDGYTKEYYLGQVEYYVPCVDVDSVIEQVTEDAYSDCGDYAEDYLSYVLPKNKAKLETRLNEVFLKWAKETGNEPTFGKVVNVEKIIVRDD